MNASYWLGSEIIGNYYDHFGGLIFGLIIFLLEEQKNGIGNSLWLSYICKKYVKIAIVASIILLSLIFWIIQNPNNF